MEAWLTFGGLGRPFESVSNLSISMKNNNFVGAAWRTLAIDRQEGGFAVELSLLVGCGLEAHDFVPSEAWTSFNHDEMISKPSFGQKNVSNYHAKLNGCTHAKDCF
jgi:hypothetical protein